MAEFVVGGLYFMLWYADDERLYLAPDSLVFLGKDLDPESGEREAWYFQDSRSYFRQGAYPNSRVDESAPDRVVGELTRLHESELDQIVDLDGLAAEVLECKARRTPRYLFVGESPLQLVTMRPGVPAEITLPLAA